MLSREDNNLLTQVGPGTPIGELFRRFWLPATLSWELPEPDCAPIRLRLLGEDLVLWRNTDGTIGAMQNACPHRGASMFFGRNEENGLRCVYHGWKFDTDGQCVDMPNEPAESNFKHKIHAAAYPCVEYTDMVWIYMGPKEQQPPLPQVDWADVPSSHRHRLRCAPLVASVVAKTGSKASAVSSETRATRPSNNSGVPAK